MQFISENNNNNNINESNDISIGLQKAIIMTYAPVGKIDIACDSQLKQLKILLKNEKIRGLRMLGSCAICMCYVASGRSHLHFEGYDTTYGPKPWDVIAGQCIVIEAGGCVYSPDNINLPFDPTTGKVLTCCNQSAAKVFDKLDLY